MGTYLLTIVLKQTGALIQEGLMLLSVELLIEVKKQVSGISNVIDLVMVKFIIYVENSINCVTEGK